jgi:YD repeat-containing protein
MINDGKRTYQYNWNNQLVTVHDEAANRRVQYTYDGVGRRVLKTMYNTTIPETLIEQTHYVYTGIRVIFPDEKLLRATIILVFCQINGRRNRQVFEEIIGVA